MSNPKFPHPDQIFISILRDFFDPEPINIKETSQEILEIPDLLKTIDETINFKALIPYDFNVSYYQSNGRPREFSIESMLKFFFLEKLLGISKDSVMLRIIKTNEIYQNFCDFKERIPDISQIYRFRLENKDGIHKVFNQLVEIMQPLFIQLDPCKAKQLISDTTGLELYVKENNSTNLTKAIKKASTKANEVLSRFQKATEYNINKKIQSYIKDKNLKNLKITKEDFFLPKLNLQTLILSQMEDYASVNPSCRLQYINATFAYANKFGIFCNGFGLPIHIQAFDQDFIVKNKFHTSTKNPENQKSLGDSKALKPMLEDFFSLHPTFSFDEFLGDAAYDSYENYRLLRDEFKFKRAIIPINPRNTKGIDNFKLSPEGIPTCPKDPQALFKKQGICREKNRSDRYKWRCPYFKLIKGKPHLDCPNPCSKSPWGPTSYTSVDQGFRAFPGIDRNSALFEKKYKKRTTIERNISSLKQSFGTADRLTQNSISSESDLLLSAITALISFIVVQTLDLPVKGKSVRKLL